MLFELFFGLKVALTANHYHADLLRDHSDAGEVMRPLTVQLIALSYAASIMLFVVISLIAHSLLWTSILLLDPWAKKDLTHPDEAEDDKK